MPMVAGDETLPEGSLAKELYDELEEMPDPAVASSEDFRVGLCVAFAEAIATHANETLPSFTNDVSINKVGTGTSAQLTLAKDDTATTNITLRSGGNVATSNRWVVQHTTAALGGHLYVLRRNATGGAVEAVWTCDWATGVITQNATTFTGAVTAGTVTATTVTTSGNVVAAGLQANGSAALLASNPRLFVGDGTGTPGIECRKATTGDYFIADVRSGGSATTNRRWVFRTVATTEDIDVRRYNSSGVFVDTPFAIRWATGRVDVTTLSLPGGVTWSAGAGSPEGVVTAPVGSLYSRTNGAAGSTLYVKESGAGNTGWAAK